MEKTPVEQTTESDITINLVDDKECSTGITVETDTCSNASKRGVSSTGKLSQSRARRSSRLSLKRRSTPETEKDPGEPSSAGNKIQHHSYVADGARVKKKIQKVADGYTSNLETRKGTQRPVLSQGQDVYMTKPSESTTQPHVLDLEIKSTNKFHKLETPEIKVDNVSVQHQRDTIPGVELNANGVQAEDPEDSSDVQVPYYLENFLHILKMVTEDVFYSELFNEEDRRKIKTFEELSGKSHSRLLFEINHLESAKKDHVGLVICVFGIF